VSPQFHVTYDDFFATVRPTARNQPTISNWQSLAGYVDSLVQEILDCPTNQVFSASAIIPINTGATTLLVGTANRPFAPTSASAMTAPAAVLAERRVRVGDLALVPAVPTRGSSELGLWLVQPPRKRHFSELLD
jgi:hypothetical protein